MFADHFYTALFSALYWADSLHSWGIWFEEVNKKVNIVLNGEGEGGTEVEEGDYMGLRIATLSPPE